MPLERSVRCLVVAVAAFYAAIPVPAASSLAVVNTALQQYDGGPPVNPGFEFFAGDLVFLSFRVAGFGTRELEDEQELLQLSYQIEAFDPEDVPLRETAADTIAAELTPEDRKNEWTPKVTFEVRVPPSAPSGTYRIAVRVRDEIAEASADQEITYTVRGRTVPPSDTIVVRNFRFLRSATDTRPLAIPAYRPGDTLWASFDITGYELGEGNRFHVNYGLTVLRASGSILFAEEVAADEEHESFYPERYVMGGPFSLNLTPELSVGEYTIVLTARDLLAGEAHESRHVFRVE